MIKPMIPLPDKKYQTIYVDPPWRYGKWGMGSEKCLLKQYQQKPTPLPYEWMTVNEIKNLPIKSLADENCELYLWTTQKYLPIAFDVLKEWGFKYCQTLTWCKTPMGTGQGGVYCPTTEFLILSRCGKMPAVERIDSTWWNIKRQNKHSKKPDFFRELIERVSNAPRIELFARQRVVNWDAWGNEVNAETSAKRIESEASQLKLFS